SREIIGIENHVGIAELIVENDDFQIIIRARRMVKTDRDFIDGAKIVPGDFNICSVFQNAPLAETNRAEPVSKAHFIKHVVGYDYFRYIPRPGENGALSNLDKDIVLDDELSGNTAAIIAQPDRVGRAVIELVPDHFQILDIR